MITEKERQDYIRYRIEKAEETFKEAVLMATNQFWNACANRLYYAIFYAITALLLKNGHATQTHKGVKNVFFQHFVRTNIMTQEQGYLLSELFDKRQAGDYADLVDWTEKDIFPLIEPTKDFIQAIKNLIEAKSEN